MDCPLDPGLWTTKYNVICFLHVSTRKTIDNFPLADHEQVLKALVTKKQKLSGKGTIEFTLKYKTNGFESINTTTNEPWTIGDSVDIVCLSDDPMIMASGL